MAFEPAAVQLLAQAGDGSMRDALSLLDQLLAYGDGRALEADARAMLGTVEREHVARIAELLARGRRSPHCSNMPRRSTNARPTTRELLAAARRAARARGTQAAGARLRGR